MNLFSRKAISNESSPFQWKPLVNVGQLKEIIKESNTGPVLIFKHSTRCGISRMVLKEFEKSFENTSNVLLYYLDLLEYRAISDEIAVHFGVIHQSPQLLIIKEGEVVFDASHENIDSGSVRHNL